MRRIALRNKAGRVVRYATIDDEDYARVCRFKWHANETNHVRPWNRAWYARRSPDNVFLHRFLMDAKPGQLVDHINGRGLDCRRSNMRFTNRRENSLNNYKRRAKRGR